MSILNPFATQTGAPAIPHCPEGRNGAGATPGTVISWVEGPEALRLLQTEWQDLAARVSADIYLTPDWFTVWWDHFARGRRLVSMVARKGGVLIGVLPFSLETIRIGPVSVRLARLAGVDSHAVFFTLALAPETAVDVLADCFAHLLGTLGCDVVSFSPLSGLAGALVQIRAAAARGPGLVLTDKANDSHTIFDLPDTFEAYLAALSARTRKRFQKNLSEIRRGFAAEPVVVLPDDHAFSEFAGFHTRQWQAVGRGGHFVDWPDSAAFYTDLAKAFGSDGRMRLDMLTGPSGPLEATFSLVAGSLCYARLPARSLDPDVVRLAVGLVGFVQTVENLIASGIRRIEDGRGAYDYKLAYGGRSVPVHRLLVSPATAAGRLRLRVLLGWVDLIDLLHYRLWFKKIAPRLQRLTGRKPRPLWLSWIRTRI